ncbi:MAG: tRNA (adenosine(37)-N6)-dimethylallyltransferase MiaA [Actinomycetota bacterium]
MTTGASPLIALVGPTASGKSQAGIALAELLDAEVVSADSMLVYRGMDIGTAKPTLDDRSRVPHHLIDVVEPREAFSVAIYQELAAESLEGIATRGSRPLIVGGSGLYFRAVADGLEFPGTDSSTRRDLETEARAGPGRLHDRLRSVDPDAAGKIEPANVRRTVRALEVAAVTGRPFSSFAGDWQRFPGERVRVAGVFMSPEVRSDRIESRVRQMLDSGLVEEVSGLVDEGLGEWLTASQAIGYAEIALYLQGVLTLEEAASRTVKRTKSLARRQLAWFRRDPRIHWFEAGSEGAGTFVDRIAEYLADG